MIFESSFNTNVITTICPNFQVGTFNEHLHTFTKKGSYFS